MADWEDDEWEEPVEVVKKKDASDIDDSDDDDAPSSPVLNESKGPKTITKDSMEELEINLQSDVTKMINLIVPKLQAATAKKTPYKFMSDACNSMQAKLTQAEADQLQKTVNILLKRRQKEEIEKNKQKLQEEEEKAKEEKAKNRAEGELDDDAYFAEFM